MKATGNTILITGGSAGIGLAIAKELNNENQLILVGRSEERLQKAAHALPGAYTLQADISNPAEVQRLSEILKADYPKLNVVINNAGSAFLYDLSDENAGASDKAGQEIQTNYLSVIQLNELLLPLLRGQEDAAIVNVSSIVAFVPGSLATYSASKAALHSYTQVLRFALHETSVKVFELMPPLVDTDFSAPIGGHRGISPAAVAERFVASFAADEFEIRVGQTEDIYQLYRSSPEDAFLAMAGRR